MSEAELKRIRARNGRKGGLARVPKGTAMLPPEERTRRSREAAHALWKKRRGQANKDE
jgi:hypothetical protein